MKVAQNCIIVDDEQIAREILISYLDKITQIKVVASCKNVQDAMAVLEKNNIDLILLDINMPEISGMQFAKILDKKIKIIFTTAYREYAVDGFDIQAIDYLLKPISFERFNSAIAKFLDLKTPELLFDNLENKSVKPTFIFVRADRKMLKISFDEILYIESLSDYIKIHTTSKTIITRETISNMEAKLPQKKFLRIHRSYIIALQKITSYTNEFIEINNKALAISRTYKEKTLEVLNKF
jgi:DNA-binding LytR/AlgR family response regulator